VLRVKATEKKQKFKTNKIVRKAWGKEWGPGNYIPSKQRNPGKEGVQYGPAKSL